MMGGRGRGFQKRRILLEKQRLITLPVGLMQDLGRQADVGNIFLLQKILKIRTVVTAGNEDSFVLVFLFHDGKQVF